MEATKKEQPLSKGYSTLYFSSDKPEIFESGDMWFRTNPDGNVTLITSQDDWERCEDINNTVVNNGE